MRQWKTCVYRSEIQACSEPSGREEEGGKHQNEPTRDEWVSDVKALVDDYTGVPGEGSLHEGAMHENHLISISGLNSTICVVFTLLSILRRNAPCRSPEFRQAIPRIDLLRSFSTNTIRSRQTPQVFTYG